MNIIPYSCQDINEDDISAVVSVLKSEYVTQGPAIPAFEDAIAKYCGTPYAVAVSSGTAGLHLACLALGIGEGDNVWTSPISFVASANCALYVGAKVDFVDVDPSTGNMSLELLEQKLIQAKKKGKLPKLLVVVHLSGRSVDMQKVSKLSKEYGFLVMEDAAHALGAEYNNKKVGSCEFSDICLFSFHPLKSITTGEGGMLMTKNKLLAENLKLLRTHGITKEAAKFENKNEGGWYYEMQQLGFHYRLTDIQAALGTSQMKRLDKFISKRRQVAKTYEEKLKSGSLLLPPVDDKSSWHLYIIQFKDTDRKSAYNKIKAAGISANVHYIPIHLQPYYRKLGFKAGDFPNAELFYSRALSIPIFPGLTEQQQNHIIKTISDILK